MLRVTKILAAVAIVGLAVSAQASTIYNLNDAFSSSNPNGVWSFGTYSQTNPIPSTWTKDTVYAAPSADGISSWSSSSGASYGYIAMYNGTHGNDWLNGPYWQTGKIMISGYRVPGVLRFTAPVAGQYQVSVTFEDDLNLGSPASAGYHEVYVGDTKTFSAALVQQTPAPHSTNVYTDTVSLTLGETIDLDTHLLSSSNISNGGSDAVYGTITLVPEPSALVVLAASLASLLAYAGRKRR
jgi:hypothetical protein